MSSNFEFLGYRAVSDDPYLIGVATVRLYGKVTVKFKHAKTKDGRDSFFAAPSISVGVPGEKKEYLKSFQLDSVGDGEMLEGFVRKSVEDSQVAAPARKNRGVADTAGLPF